MTTTLDTIDPDTVPADLREAWRNRDAGSLAHFAGVWCQSRAEATCWRSRDRQLMVVVWRKRGRLYAHAGAGETVGEAVKRPGEPLESWGQLEVLVAGLVPALVHVRVSPLVDPGPPTPAWVELVAPSKGGTMTGNQASLDTDATPRTWSSIETLTTYDTGKAVESASSLVFNMQHDGKHEQARYDAMKWQERYTKAGRCKCAKCDRQWERGAP